MHTKFTVKGSKSFERTLEIVKELHAGYLVRLINKGEWRQTESTEFMTRSLFESCIRTGYLRPVPEPSHRIARTHRLERPVSVPA